MRKVDAILRQQSFVDRSAPPMAGQGEGTHVGNHQGQNEAVAAGHLKDDQHRCHGGADGAGKDSAHADHSECADGVGRVVEDDYVHEADRATQHGAHEKRRRKDSARAAARVRTDRGSKLEDTKDGHGGHRHFARERQREGFVWVAGDAIEME